MVIPVGGVHGNIYHKARDVFQYAAEYHGQRYELGLAVLETVQEEYDEHPSEAVYGYPRTVHHAAVDELVVFVDVYPDFPEPAHKTEAEEHHYEIGELVLVSLVELGDARKDIGHDVFRVLLAVLDYGFAVLAVGVNISLAAEDGLVEMLPVDVLSAPQTEVELRFELHENGLGNEYPRKGNEIQQIQRDISEQGDEHLPFVAVGHLLGEVLDLLPREGRVLREQVGHHAVLEGLIDETHNGEHPEIHDDGVFEIYPCEVHESLLTEGREYALEASPLLEAVLHHEPRPSDLHDALQYLIDYRRHDTYYDEQYYDLARVALYVVLVHAEELYRQRRAAGQSVDDILCDRISRGVQIFTYARIIQVFFEHRHVVGRHEAVKPEHSVHAVKDGSLRIAARSEEGEKECREHHYRP